MIENEEKGIKIAENPQEALWNKVVMARNQNIKNYEEAMEVEKVFLDAAERKLADIQSEKEDGKQ